MQVTRTSLYEGARDATGTAVIIDVYRAFTTAAFCMAAGATEIVLTASHGAALKMKAKDPTLFLTGEIGGKPIPGFDVGNSPSKIEGLDLNGRRVTGSGRRYDGRLRESTGRNQDRGGGKQEQLLHLVLLIRICAATTPHRRQRSRLWEPITIFSRL
jgi:hypothetical protein